MSSENFLLARLSENFLLARLSQNFETLLQISNNNHDVIINVGDELNSKTFYAHSLILTSQSTYFKTALSSNWIKKDEDKIIFEKPNVSSKIFETILKHLYCGVVNLKEFTPLELLDLISSADEFMLPELMSFTESHLLSLADSWMNTDFFKVHLHAQKFSECKNLREFCVKKICKNPEIIFESNDFINLSEVMLIDLLKKDDFEMDEIELWKYVVQWGIHKCSTNLNGKNVNEWNDENFKELWEIIKNLVELIRFYDISIENFYNMVKPYSSMFPRDMFENLLWNYIMPQSNKHSRRKRLGFGPTTNARPFGQTTTTPSSGFGFGRQTTTTTAPSSGGFGFGRQTTTTTAPSSGGFGFGHQTTTTTAPSSGFGFGHQTTTTTAPSSSFGFGQIIIPDPPEEEDDDI
ncbi:hypothetical protein C1645_876081 [Glomus cerebriforme]|uniref:BTB domain-containing protein n=1 Tax=Glomus cerebriforme TaxID=658196 RepID=A0A397T5P4_9GLOM|nr:hypothetical protein C1645_876081 [Glomus cerebriforme]